MNRTAQEHVLDPQGLRCEALGNVYGRFAVHLVGSGGQEQLWSAVPCGRLWHEFCILPLYPETKPKSGSLYDCTHDLCRESGGMTMSNWKPIEAYSGKIRDISAYGRKPGFSA
ncbi:MAG: hypothetical protein Q8O86_11855, partial [Dehalococcoidia bacterium]|nr:hypothetical protein [Dehalococcoidia bacterium]